VNQVTQVTQPTSDILSLIVQVILIVVPVLITWFIRTYVRGSRAEQDIAAITRLSNNAINYVENLDKRGDLNLPPNVSKGAQKLQLAGNWLEDELKRAGISMTNEQAQTWIGSEFQKRLGDVRMVGTLAELAGTAVDLVRSLERNGQITLPPSADRIAYLADLAADWLVAQYAMQGAVITREEAVTWARAELLRSLQLPDNALPSNAQLAELAQRAVAFLKSLKQSGRLTVRSGVPGGSVDADIATAWLLTEVARQGLVVTSDQIGEAIAAAMRK